MSVVTLAFIIDIASSFQVRVPELFYAYRQKLSRVLLIAGFISAPQRELLACVWFHEVFHPFFLKS